LIISFLKQDGETLQKTKKRGCRVASRSASPARLYFVLPGSLGHKAAGEAERVLAETLVWETKRICLQSVVQKAAAIEVKLNHYTTLERVHELAAQFEEVNNELNRAQVPHSRLDDTTLQ
jgi:hypothetical protein